MDRDGSLFIRGIVAGGELLVSGLAGERNADAQNCLDHLPPPGNSDRLVVEVGPLSALCPKSLVQKRNMSDPGDGLPLLGKRDVHREYRQANEEIRRAVERIDNPDIVGIGSWNQPAFLAEEAVVRTK